MSGGQAFGGRTRQMKRALPLAAFVALAMPALPILAQAGKVAWTAGWDNFGEPLTYAKSSVGWAVSPTAKTITATFTLTGAQPGKLYQIALLFFN